MNVSGSRNPESTKKTGRNHHGKIKDVAHTGRSHQWLKRAGLKEHTETLIMAAQKLSSRNHLCKQDRNQEAGWAKMPLKQSSTQTLGARCRQVKRKWSTITWW
ncbi:hypothetical protein CHARACLAT_027834 [Characodon lateralis]|uniref:Uncharacterized protein n=1 Tax=Characodon lateralis TaxID=208331 RepID=A0ABU7CRU6_9TELE|nr:hypothetical protein [Characodon lateralis]